MANPACAPRRLAAALLLGVLAGCSQAPPQADAPTGQPAPAAVPSEKSIAQTPGNCAIDKQVRSPANVALLGWAVGNPSEAPAAITVEVQSGGKSQMFATKILDRPDIAKAYKSDALLRTGFLAEIPAVDATAGAKISISIENSTEIYRCKNTFDLQ